MSSTNPDKKSKAYQLERIRNNQRRSRIRKQDHVAALEARIRDYEEAEAQRASQHSRPDVEESSRIQKQNSHLRRLLEAIGINEDFQNAYLTSADDIRPNPLDHQQGKEAPLTGTVAVDNQQNFRALSRPSVASPTERLTASSPATSESSSFFDEWMQNPMTDAFTLSSSSFTPSPSRTVEQQSDIFNNVTPNPSPISLVTQLQTGSPVGLTPCSLAYSLVTQYNRKGYSATYIDIRLYSGYRACALIGDGCAVEDKVLFGVLADVS